MKRDGVFIGFLVVFAYLLFFLNHYFLFSEDQKVAEQMRSFASENGFITCEESFCYNSSHFCELFSRSGCYDNIIGDCFPLGSCVGPRGGSLE